MRIVRIATLALATTLFASPAFADDAPAAPAGDGAAASATAAAPAAAPAAAAEGDDGKKIGVGGDLLFSLPIGDYADTTGPQIGASLRGGYYVMPALEAYLRVGYQFGLKKDFAIPTGLGSASVKYGINDLSVMLGGRYFFMQPYSGLYGNVEIGMHILSASIDPSPPVSPDSLTRFGANIGAGYVISKDLPINIGAQFALVNLIGKESGEKTLFGINIMAGYEARF
jgi:hypothetical protein